MPIVETKIVNRPDTSVLFFSDTDNYISLRTKETIGYEIVEQTPTYIKYIGTKVKITGERIFTNNGLTQTYITTFDSLEDYSQVDTLIGIDGDVEYLKYVEDHGLTHPENQYTQSGIAQPFTCTTTYNYTPETATLYPLFNYFINVIEASEKLISLVNTGSQIVAVHEYQNSEDFTADHWADFAFVKQLYTGNVTRTITYALL